MDPMTMGIGGLAGGGLSTSSSASGGKAGAPVTTGEITIPNYSSGLSVDPRLLMFGAGALALYVVLKRLRK